MASSTVNPICIAASDTSITTCTVSLRTIQVNNRQMSQSIFKQLPTIGLFDPATLQLRGIVWGWVNYKLKSEGNKNFLVQVGDRLFTSELCTSFNFTNTLEFLDRHPTGGLPRDVKDWLYETERRTKGVFPEGYGSKWDALMKTLAAAPQIFIAA